MGNSSDSFSKQTALFHSLKCLTGRSTHGFLLIHYPYTGGHSSSAITGHLRYISEQDDHGSVQRLSNCTLAVALLKALTGEQLLSAAVWHSIHYYGQLRRRSMERLRVASEQKSEEDWRSQERMG